MTYPMSSAVVAGQATEADQYNFLRNDALCLGSDPASSGTLRDLLYQNIGELRLSRSSKTVIRLEAAADAPCALMISGAIFAVKQELTVNLSADSFPNPGRLYLYAVGASDGSFTLRAGDLTIPSGGRRIGTFVWSGSGVIPGTVHTISEWNRLQAQALPPLAQGRLTLISGEPVPDADITLGETLYFTPYRGNTISLYLGGNWEAFQFPELSLGLSGMLRGIPYDVFLEADENGLKLTTSSWGTTSARPSGMLSRVDGVRVAAGDRGRRYLGTIALNDAGYGEDSQSERLLWNENHRLPRPLLSRLTTDKTSGTAHMGNWAPYYDADAPVVRVLLPCADAEFVLEGVGIGSEISESDRAYGRAAAVGICRDMVMESPYTGNENCADVFTHTNGNAPMRVTVRNRDAAFLGCHSYTLAFWSNYSFYPIGTNLPACGEHPGLSGVIWG